MAETERRNWDKIIDSLEKGYETVVPAKNRNCAAVQAWRVRNTYHGIDVRTEQENIILSLS